MSRLEGKAWGSHSCGEPGGPTSSPGDMKDPGDTFRRVTWALEREVLGGPACETLGRQLHLTQQARCHHSHL